MCCHSGQALRSVIRDLQGIDTDHSGTITVEELKAGMKKAGSPVAMAELQALLSHIDVDQNGARRSTNLVDLCRLEWCRFLDWVWAAVQNVCMSLAQAS